MSGAGPDPDGLTPSRTHSATRGGGAPAFWWSATGAFGVAVCCCAPSEAEGRAAPPPPPRGDCTCDVLPLHSPLAGPDVGRAAARGLLGRKHNGFQTGEGACVTSRRTGAENRQAVRSWRAPRPPPPHPRMSKTWWRSGPAPSSHPNFAAGIGPPGGQNFSFKTPTYECSKCAVQRGGHFEVCFGVPGTPDRPKLPKDTRPPRPPQQGPKG